MAVRKVLWSQNYLCNRTDREKKKSQREQTYLPTHPACKERGSFHSANPLSTFSQEVQAPCPGLGHWWRWDTLANCQVLLCVLFYVFSIRLKLIGLGTVSSLLNVFCSAWCNRSPPAPGWLMTVSMAPRGVVLCRVLTTEYPDFVQPRGLQWVWFQWSVCQGNRLAKGLVTTQDVWFLRCLPVPQQTLATQQELCFLTEGKYCQAPVSTLPL